MPFYDISPFPLVVDILLPTVEHYGYLSLTADARVTFSLPDLGLPTMTKIYSTFTQTIRTHLGLFRAASSLIRAEFPMPCSWICNKTVKIWDAATGQCLSTLTTNYILFTPFDGLFFSELLALSLLFFFG